MHMYLPVANRDVTPDRLGGHTNTQTTETRRSNFGVIMSIGKEIWLGQL